MFVAWLWLPTVAFAVPQDFEGRRFYSGDLHVHTGASGDGMSSDVGECTGVCGAMADVAHDAAAAGLDFVAITDHANGWTISSPDLFQGALHWALEAHVPGEFVVVPGAEVWFELPDGSPLGHKNLLLFGTEEQTADFDMFSAQVDSGAATVQDCDRVWAYAAELQQRFGPLLLIPHHPAAVIPMVTDWSCQDDGFAPAVEIYSEHGNSERPAPAFDPQWSDPAPAGTSVFEALHPDGPGHRMGFVGGTDRHDTHAGDVCTIETAMFGPPYGGGLTMAVLDPDEVFDRGALYRAVVDRRTYATSGPALPALLEVLVDGRVVADMGQVASVPSGAGLTVRVSVPDADAAGVLRVLLTTPSGRLEASHDGANRWTLGLDGMPAFVYAELHLDGGAWNPDCSDGGDSTEERVWLSPIWLEEGAGPSSGRATGGCGCSSTTGLGGWLLFVPLFLLRRRASRRTRTRCPLCCAGQRPPAPMWC